MGYPLFYFALRAGGTRRCEMQYAGGILLQPVQKLVATLIFARLTQGQKCKRVPSGVPRVTNPNFLPVGEGFGFVVYFTYPY